MISHAYLQVLVHIQGVWDWNQDQTVYMRYYYYICITLGLASGEWCSIRIQKDIQRITLFYDLTLNNGKWVKISITMMLHVSHGFSNHCQLDCWFNSLFRLTTKKISKPLYCWPFSDGNPLATGRFPSIDSNAERVLCNDVIMMDPKWYEFCYFWRCGHNLKSVILKLILCINTLNASSKLLLSERPNLDWWFSSNTVQRDLISDNSVSILIKGPSDAIWQHRSGSTLAHVMACCLMAPSHYLNQCWQNISEVLWHSPEGDFTRNAQDTYPSYQFENN